jgi:site-specific recombinase XerD
MTDPNKPGDKTSPGETERPRKSSRQSPRAEPITRRVAKNGTVSYEFRAVVGVKPDGSPDRQRFSYRTVTEARKELRKISTNVAAGTYAKRIELTVDEACDEWLSSRRAIRKVTVYSYENDLKPVRRYLGKRKLQQLTKADGDDLVEWMLTAARTSPRHFRPNSLASRVEILLTYYPDGVAAAELVAAFPEADVYTCLHALAATGRATRLKRGVYAPVTDEENAAEEATKQGLAPITVRSTLTTFTTMVQSFVDQGVLPRNVISLVERPKDADGESVESTGDAIRENAGADDVDEPTFKSWTLTEVQTFRDSVRDHRLYACWLLSCYGLRRSEVLGLRWNVINLETGLLLVRRGRVAVGTETVEGNPKSRRSRRDLPMPRDVIDALSMLKSRQQSEARALGLRWSDDRLIAVSEDGTPVRPGRYTDEFQLLRQRAGLRRIRLHGLRNTSVSLMLDQGHPVHIVAAWHGHNPAVSLSIYADAKSNELRAAGEGLFS